uniref:Probable 3-oxoacyl-[acyl-carrier-protein] reductase oxidoreductase (EC) n=1 Tax=Ganoderma boninense TaxID=34458 RepID=A0A5K1JZK3_9APHY|nr:Probable 3-oxoacyl-[acyl-carrier-protein] reductase oxidoreductase (EC [Ganoderma boninense]
MHQLRALTITFNLDDDPDYRSWTSDPRLEPLSAAAVSRLTRVTVPAVLLPSFSVSCLQHITLTNMCGRFSPEGRLASYEGLCQALAICAASLESLVLLNVAPRAYDSPSPSLSISLPALRHLRITDTARRCTLALSHIAFPDSTHIGCTNVDNGALCATLPIDSASVNAHLSATDSVAIRSTADATSVHCLAGPDGREVLCVGLAGIRRGLRPDDLVRLFRQGARVTRLTVAGLDGRDVPGVEFRAFPHLVRLDVSGEMAGYVLQNLARRDDEAGDLDGVRRRGNGVCPGLETLVVDFHFAQGTVKGELGAALRNGDVSVVEADLHRRCTELVRTLAQRLQMGGSNISRLEFGCTEQSRFVGPNERKCTPTLRVWPTGSESWRPIVEPLEKLVDGPVVFTGYHFFAVDQLKAQ